ncbi:MAG: lysostaphin resistance A-like protein [Smithellaceae bacterium]
MVLTTIQYNQLSRKQLAIFVVFLLIFFYLPVTLLWTGVIPFRFRFVVTFGAIIGMLFYARARKLDWSGLGFRRDTLKRSLLWNCGVTLLFLAILYYLHNSGLIVKDTAHLWPIFYIFYILVLSPVQEFFFRSILFAELRMVRPRSPWFMIMLSSFSFCFLHVIYRCPLTMLISLFMGIVWGVIYYRYPNFWGVTFSHAVLGTAAIAVGLI